MTFSQSVRTCLVRKYFFVFKGRACRSEFWWFMLFIGLVNLVSGMALTLLPRKWALSISLAISLMLLPANFGVTVRRLHDRNLHGWWLALPLGSLFLWILGGGGTQAQAGAILSMAMNLGYLALLCMPGQKGPNRFGDDPLPEP